MAQLSLICLSKTVLIYAGLAVSFLLCFLNKEVRVLLNLRWQQFWAGEVMQQASNKNMAVAKPNFLETLPLNGLINEKNSSENGSDR